MWNKRVLGAFMTLGIVLVACSPGASSSPGASGNASPSFQPAADQTFRFGSNEPRSLDPAAATDSGSIVVLHQLARPLLWFTPDLQLTTDGGLAATYKLSDDGKTLTFTLKPGLKYSNGDPIKAADFVTSIQRLADPRCDACAAGYQYVLGSGYMNLVGADDAMGATGKADAVIDGLLAKIGVKAPDDTTVEFDMTTTTSYAPYFATYWMFSPVEKTFAATKGAFDGSVEYVGSGPFKLTKWNHNANITMDANPNWTAGDPAKLKTVEMTIYSNQDLTYDAYRNDELDMTRVPPANIPEVKADADLSKEVLQSNVLCTYYIGFDMRADASGNPIALIGKSKELRHALSESVDRAALVNTVNQGVGTPAMSMVPKGMSGNEPNVGLKYDVTKAKADLQTALGNLGVTAADLSEGGKSELELGFNSGAGHEPIMEFLQGQWSTNLGIKVKLTGLEWNSFLDRLDKKPFTMFRLGWCQDYPHPNNFLNDVFGCNGSTPGGNNESRWCNKQYNDLLASAGKTLDLKAQLPIYSQAQAILVDEAPAVFLYWYGRFNLIKPYVVGLTATAGDSTTGEYFFDRIQIAKH